MGFDRCGVSKRMGGRMSNLAKIIDYLPEQFMAEKVLALQAEVLKLPQFEPVTRHEFHGGMYRREVEQPAGVIIIGKVHKMEHFFIILSGEVAVTVNDKVERVIGPKMFCSHPGEKRAIYAITDAVFMTIHRTDSITVEDAESEMVEEGLESPFTTGNILRNKLQES